MREDGRQSDLLAVSILGVAGATRSHLDLAGRLDPGDLQTPTNHVAHRIQCSLTGSNRSVVTHHGDAESTGVEATCVCALDILIQATVAALEDVAVLVDKGVVSDVAPAQSLCVVLVNAADDTSGLALGVVV